jgi:Phage tail protein.
VTGILYAADETEAQTLLDAIHAFSNKRGLELWYKGRRIKIDKLLESSLQDTGKKGFLYNISISYQAGDPFWYGEEKEENFNLGGIYGYEHSIVVGGTADTFPVITLTMADSGGPVSLDINGLGCELARLLVAEDIIEIDSYNGTVKVNGENAIGYFSGAFPRLLGGQNNSIQYSGPACLASIKYSEAYI